MAISLLGPLEVDGAERLAPRDRVVLTALVLHAGEVVAPDRLADAIWGDAPPESWAKIVQGSVVRLRKALGHGAVETTSTGYRLVVPDQQIDLRRFDRLLERGTELAGRAEHERAAATLTDALALWRGPALRDVEHWDDGRAELARLEERRREAEELLLQEELAGGRDVVGRARALCAAEPLRERRWALLAAALYRAGRQGEALAALRTARTTLREELGLDPGPELQAFEAAVLRQDPALSARPAASVAAACPWKGLLALGPENADTLSGRSEEIAACVRVLSAEPLLVVAGASGTGKSSLVRAGVVPALESTRPVHVVVPGSDPVGSLVAALSRPDRPPMLVVDQVEEVFTGLHDGDVVRMFLHRVVEALRSGEQVVLVLRADAVGSLATDPELARRVERGLVLLSPLDEDGLRQVVEAPARLAGLRLEPGLVDLLLRDVEGELGALPLLSHALIETWQRREANVLTLDGYRATGGIRSAVARTAEQLHDALSPDERTVLRAIMLRLVVPGPSGEPVATRVPLPHVTLDARYRVVLDRVVQARLVTVDAETVAVAHEVLLRAWPRLRAWQDEDAAGARLLRHLTLAAEDWDARGRDDVDLYRGPRLATAVRRRPAAAELTPIEQAFLAASQAQEQADHEAVATLARQRQSQHRRLRVALVASVAALAVATAAGLLAVQRTGDAERTATSARIDRLVAASRSLTASQRDLAALLAVAAYRLRPDATTRSVLLHVFTAAPGFVDSRATPAPTGDAALLPDGRTVLAVGTDGRLRAFDVDGRMVRAWPTPATRSDGALLAVSADGRTAATVAWRQVDAGRALLTVQDVASGRQRLAPVIVPLDPQAAAVSADGRFVAVGGGSEGHVLVYDTTGRTVLPEVVTAGLPQLPDGVHEVPASGAKSSGVALAFRPDGRLLVADGTPILRLADPVTGAVTGTLAGAPPATTDQRLLVTAHGPVVATGSAGATAWRPDGQLLWTRQLPHSACTRVALQGSELLCGGVAGHVVGLDLMTGRSTATDLDGQHGAVTAVVAAADGVTVVVLSGTEPVRTRWRLDGTGPVTRRLALPAPLGTWSPDGRWLLLGGTPGSASAEPPVVVDARSGGIIAVLRGAAVAVWGRSGDELVTWTDSGLAQLARFAAAPIGRLNGGFGEVPVGVQVTGRGDARRLVAWESGGPGVEVWQLGTGQVLAARGVPRLEQAVLTADGSTLVVRTASGLTSLPASGGAALAHAPPAGLLAATSGTGVISSGSDGVLRVLDARSLRPVGPQPATAPGALVGIVTDSAGRLAAAHGVDGRVRLYDLPTGTQLGEPIAGPIAAGQVALRPDGGELAVPSDSGALVMDLEPEQHVRAACLLAGRRLTEQERTTYLRGLDSPPSCAS